VNLQFNRRLTSYQNKRAVTLDMYIFDALAYTEKHFPNKPTALNKKIRLFSGASCNASPDNLG